MNVFIDWACSFKSMLKMNAVIKYGSDCLIIDDALHINKAILPLGKWPHDRD